MDDGPWLYYKLTNEPKGSGELIIIVSPIEVCKLNKQSEYYLIILCVTLIGCHREKDSEGKR